MKLSIARSELLDALTVVSKGLSARSTLPILSGILISAEDGSFTMQTTDLEISVRHKAPALVEEDGTIVVPGKLLTDIVRSLPEAAVTIESEGEVAMIRCQQSSFTVKTLNPADFPKFPEVAVEKTISLPADAMASMVKKVSKAVSRDETRAIITGVLLVIEGQTVRMVATDSYRLAMVEKIIEKTIGEELEVVVPGRALDEAIRLAAGSEAITMGVSENQVVFTFGESTFVTRKIEGSFPNYKQIIPKESESVVTLSVDEFLSAVKRVSLLALHNTPLKIGIRAEDQTVSISATTQDVGDASEDLMSKVEGKDVDIAFNHAFLIDGLNSATGDTIELEVQSALKPGLLKNKGEEDFLYLLMPVRLG